MAKLDKLLVQAKDHFEQGEEVVAAVQGAYEVERAGQDSVRRGAFIATNRRLVFFAKKLTGFDLEVFPYENISSIEMGKNMMGHHISFFASGNKAAMKWIAKGQDVSGFIEAVKSRMKGGASTVPDAGTDSMGQIRTLAELRDEGILTEEEFQAKKAQLLAL